MEPDPQVTCWTLIRAAAAGQAAERDEFSRRYLGPVRAYLTARWRTTPFLGDLDDVVQEVFVACFRTGGALERATPQAGGFRAFLFGVTRNVALHHERTRARRDRRHEPVPESETLAGDAPTASRAYDQEYARALLRESALVMAARAAAGGAAARRRVELLRLRFEDGLPIREIALRWQCEALALHREYAKAGREFKAALRTVVGLSERCPAAALDQECDRLLELLR